ncbi:uncharacterized protein LOC129595257 [Paramacrobiotus metropolitanus]|uniref:uncharacterized protein LOC129595257 n=1 Tax=Paramacrobiotus metropolitanus TaxID=2943436 RepID=UPI0024460F60|nr:uncharacterized protein LOC129595257 [Paramacrobiotus metropolitanus]
MWGMTGVGVVAVLSSVILCGCLVDGQTTQCSIPNYRVMAIPLPGFTNVYTNATGTYYTGFVIDLLYAMARVANFTFTISLGNPSDFGRTTGQASSGGCFGGGIGSLQSGGFDILAAAMDYVYGYNTAVDFTAPIFRSDVQFIYNTYTGLANSYYMVIGNTAGRDLLENSKDPTLMAIWANIQKWLPTSLPNTYEEAIALVKMGGWALFGRTPLIDQAVCDSYGQIAKDPKVYKRTYASFAVQKNSNILSKLNLAILQLQGDNTIDNLLYKWFPCSNFACS